MKTNNLAPKGLFLLTTLLISCLMISCNGNKKSANQIIAEKLDSLFTARYGENTPGGTVYIMKGDETVFKKDYGDFTK